MNDLLHIEFRNAYQALSWAFELEDKRLIRYASWWVKQVYAEMQERGMV